MKLIDTHNHLDFDIFNKDRKSIIENCNQLGIDKQIIPSIQSNRWNNVLQLTTLYPNIFIALGLHPLFINSHSFTDINKLNHLIKRLFNYSKLVAIGECGLDFYNNTLSKPKQIFFFEKQLMIAREFNLPVILHIRKAHSNAIAILKKLKLKRAGVIHAFSGSYEEAKEYIKLGFYLGIGGAATWPNAKKINAILTKVPITSLLLETDAPDMAPSMHLNKRNSPENLPNICINIANKLQITPDYLAEITSQNAKNLFQLK